MRFRALDDQFQVTIDGGTRNFDLTPGGIEECLVWVLMEEEAKRLVMADDHWQELEIMDEELRLCGQEIKDLESQLRERDYERNNY